MDPPGARGLPGPVPRGWTPWLQAPWPPAASPGEFHTPVPLPAVLGRGADTEAPARTISCPGPRFFLLAFISRAVFAVQASLAGTRCPATARREARPRPTQRQHPAPEERRADSAGRGGVTEPGRGRSRKSPRAWRPCAGCRCSSGPCCCGGPGPRAPSGPSWCRTATWTWAGCTPCRWVRAPPSGGPASGGLRAGVPPCLRDLVYLRGAARWLGGVLHGRVGGAEGPCGVDRGTQFKAATG